jgi:hypothetical protein
VNAEGGIHACKKPPARHGSQAAFGCLVWAELRPVFGDIALVQQLQEVGRWERWLSSIELIELLDEDLSVCMSLFNPELTH